MNITEEQKRVLRDLFAAPDDADIPRSILVVTCGETDERFGDIAVCWPEGGFDRLQTIGLLEYAKASIMEDKD